MQETRGSQLHVELEMVELETLERVELIDLVHNGKIKTENKQKILKVSPKHRG